MLRNIFLFLFFLLPFSVHAQSVNVLFHKAGDPVAGNPAGSITLVEFFDYECSHCENMAPVIDNLIRSNPSLRVVYKDYPVLGPTSIYAARASVAAKKQNAYLRLHQALFANSDLTPDSITATAGNVGLNTSKLKTDMMSDAVTKQLQANTRLAKELGVPGTPAFFIGKTDATSMDQVRSFMGEVGQSELQRAIDSSK
jgi:protein-disulfide isomerase